MPNTVQHLAKYSKNPVEHFIQILDILLYATHRNKPFSIADIQKDVLDITSQRIRRYLRQLVQAGFLQQGESVQVYIVTDYTRDLLNSHNEIKN